MTKETYEASKQAMIEEIERAFDGVAREDGVTLHEADVVDNYGSNLERSEARLEDTETRWQDVPDEHIRRHDSNLAFLDAKGFHYYFPAYLIWDLRFADCEDEGFWSNTFDSIKYKLLAFTGYQIGDLFLDRFSLFSPQQKATVAQYVEFQIQRLDFVTEDEDLGTMMDDTRRDYQWALDIYWGQFLQDHA